MTPLHHLGELLRQSLAAIPLSVVRVMIVAMLSAVLLWVLVLPRAETTPAPSSVRHTEKTFDRARPSNEEFRRSTGLEDDQVFRRLPAVEKNRVRPNQGDHAQQ